MYRIATASIVLLSLMNCNAQKEIKKSPNEMATQKKVENKIIYLLEGEKIFLKEFETNIGFKNISEDSRCPEGTNCIWEGVAVANIEVMGIATRPYTLSIATTDNVSKGYSKTAAFNGNIITLKSVNPYPTVKDGTKSLDNKYKIGITITKEAASTDSTKK